MTIGYTAPWIEKAGIFSACVAEMAKKLFSMPCFLGRDSA
jgi:hypothetical protein